MNRSAVAQIALSFPAALLLSLVLAGQAMAATWSAPVRIATDPEYETGGLATVAPSTVIAVYAKKIDGVGAVFIRRSADGGATWQPRVRLSEPDADKSVPSVAIASYGTDVDVVWLEEDEYSSSGRIRYARSADGGATFAAPVALSAWGIFSGPQVARGPSGRVAVTSVEWPELDAVFSDVFIQVSTDGGATFAPRRLLWDDADPFTEAVAIGDGVIYAAYSCPWWASARRARGIHLRRSLDDGATWSESTKLAGTRAHAVSISLTAEGSNAYLGYEGYRSDWTAVVRYRRTSDRGVTWSSPQNLTGSSWDFEDPVLLLQDGVVHAAFIREPYSDAQQIYYRQSADGIHWSRREAVTEGGWVPDVAFVADKAFVLYLRDQELLVQTRTP